MKKSYSRRRTSHSSTKSNPYRITPYTYSQAKKYNVTVKLSSTKHKKLDVYDKNNEKIATVGDNRYADYPTFWNKYGKSYADSRRKLYKQRHEKDRHIIGSKGYWADVLLW